MVQWHHKVLTYIEYRAVSGVFRTIDPPPPLHPESVSSPRTKGGGYTPKTFHIQTFDLAWLSACVAGSSLIFQWKWTWSDLKLAVQRREF
jgi:hypothetical protein